MLLVLTCIGFAKVAVAVEPVTKNEQEALVTRYKSDIAPLLKTICSDCHGLDDPKSKVSLHNLQVDLTEESSLATWRRVLEQIEISAMPPEGEQQPTPGQRVQIVRWITDMLIVAGQGFEFESRRLLPEFGNRVNHELLFDGSIKDLPASPSRLWRMSPFI
jgi:uncharacterized membrane protein